MDNKSSNFVKLSRGAGALQEGEFVDSKVSEFPNNALKSFVYEIPHQVINLSEGEILFKEGDAPQGLYLMKSGCVKLVVKRTQNRGRTTTPEYVTKLVSPGEVFGYKALVKNSNHHLHAMSVRDSVLWLYSKEAIQAAIGQVHPLIKNILEQSIGDLESYETTTQLHYLASVQERIANQILVLADRFGVPSKNGIALNLKLTRNEFAQLASTINESLSRHLTEFKNENLIELEGKEIVIKDRAGLEKIAGKLTV